MKIRLMPDRGAARIRPNRDGLAWAHLRVRAAVLALWLLVGVAAAGGIFAALLGRPAKATAAATVPPSPVGPAGWAQLYVAAFLAAGDTTSASLSPFLADPPSLSGVNSNTLAASSTVALDATVAGPQYWSVTVAAQVEGASPSGGDWRPLGVRYYTVGVVDQAGRYIATGLPAEVAAPAAAATPKLALPLPSAPAPGDPQVDTVAHFLQAFLCGQGELSRYTPAGSSLRPVTPPPFQTVTLTGIAKRSQRPSPTTAAFTWVDAQVNATDPAGRTEQLAYTFELDHQAGQWVVSALLAAPPLAATSTPTTRR